MPISLMREKDLRRAQVNVVNARDHQCEHPHTDEDDEVCHRVGRRWLGQQGAFQVDVGHRHQREHPVLILKLASRTF